MNKRDLLAWQIWCERQPATMTSKWRRVSNSVPMFLRIPFARYVSMKFMGGQNGFLMRVMSSFSFWVVCKLIFPLSK